MNKLLPDAMQPKELSKKIRNLRFSHFTDELVRSEAVDFVSGKAQLAIC